MNVCAEEAADAYQADIVHFLPSNNPEEMEANVEHIVEWLSAASQSR